MPDAPVPASPASDVPSPDSPPPDAPVPDASARLRLEVDVAEGAMSSPAAGTPDAFDASTPAPASDAPTPGTTPTPGGALGVLLALAALLCVLAAAPATAQPFAPGFDITTDADGARSVYSADIDGDGDLDVLSASRFDNTIAWYDNVNGDGSAWTKVDITTGADGARIVYAADIDGDGDLDVLSASTSDDTIALYRNGDATSGGGDGSAWNETEITTDRRRRHERLCGGHRRRRRPRRALRLRIDDTIAWYDNVNGDGSAWIKTKITTGADGARASTRPTSTATATSTCSPPPRVTTRLRSTATATRPPGAATAARGARP